MLVYIMINTSDDTTLSHPYRAPHHCLPESSPVVPQQLAWTITGSESAPWWKPAESIMSVTVAPDKSWDWELFLALLKIGVIRVLCANSLSFILEHFRRTGKEGERQKAKALTQLHKKQANLVTGIKYSGTPTDIS